MAPDDFDKDAVDAKVKAIEGLLAGHTDRIEEAQILDLLRGALPRELDHLLGRLSLTRLFSSVDDRVVGPDNLTALLQLLCEERLADLSIPTRATLIFALQRGRTSSVDEGAIGRVLLGTRGAELTDLKNAIDDGGERGEAREERSRRNSITLPRMARGAHVQGHHWLGIRCVCQTDDCRGGRSQNEDPVARRAAGGQHRRRLSAPL